MEGRPRSEPEPGSSGPHRAGTEDPWSSAPLWDPVPFRSAGSEKDRCPDGDGGGRTSEPQHGVPLLPEKRHGRLERHDADRPPDFEQRKRAEPVLPRGQPGDERALSDRQKNVRHSPQRHRHKIERVRSPRDPHQDERRDKKGRSCERDRPGRKGSSLSGESDRGGHVDDVRENEPRAGEPGQVRQFLEPEHEERRREERHANEDRPDQEQAQTSLVRLR